MAVVLHAALRGGMLAAAENPTKIKPDDLIVYLEGLPTPDINTFNRLLASYGPGQEVKLEIQRGDKLTTVPIKLEKLPEKKKK